MTKKDVCSPEDKSTNRYNQVFETTHQRLSINEQLGLAIARIARGQTIEGRALIGSVLCSLDILCGAEELQQEIARSQYMPPPITPPLKPKEQQ